MAHLSDIQQTMRVTSPVRKAVIPAAGLGTRFLPASKAQPKEMLALIDKPTIQYIVEEAVSVGITDILIVTGRNKISIEDHFDRSFELEATLRSTGKDKLAEEMQAIAELADVHFIRQGTPKGLGHAVMMAKEHVGNEPFVVMLGDDVMHEKSGVLQNMLNAYEQVQRPVVALKRVAPEEISSYGCAAVKEDAEGVVSITDIVEKPAVEDAPSNLAVMGRYVLTPDIFDILAQTKPGAGNEIQVTDALASFIQSGGLYGWTFDWGRFDIGKKIDYLRATVELALERPDLGAEFRQFLNEIVARDSQA